MLDHCPFKAGDEVVLKTGKSKIIVLEVDYFQCSCPKTSPPKTKKYRRPRAGWYIRFMYASAMSYHHNNGSEHRTWREADDFEFYHPQEAILLPKLYQTIKEPILYGTFLTKDSQGNIVLEMKGGGGVQAYKPSDIEEVLPYTVALTRYEGGDAGGETRHYAFKKGALKKGDVLVHLSNGNLWKVSELNTKHASPSPSKNGFFKLEGSIVPTE